MVEQALILMKARIGLSTGVRDSYMTEIIKSVIEELTESNRIVLEKTNANHLMFVVDYATWRYLNRDSPSGMPRHIQFRLHNLIIDRGLGDGT